MWSCDYNWKKRKGKSKTALCGWANVAFFGVVSWPQWAQNRIPYSWTSFALFPGGRVPLPKKNTSINNNGTQRCHGGRKAEAWLSLHSLCSNRDNFPWPAPSIPNTAPHPENSLASTKPGPGAKAWGVNNTYHSPLSLIWSAYCLPPADSLRWEAGPACSPFQLLPAGDLTPPLS